MMKATTPGNGHAITQPPVTVDFEDVLDTVIYLRVFPWSMKDDAKEWLESLPEGEIASWDVMEDWFLQWFFPALKAAKLQSDINHFVQNPSETFFEAWTRFGKMLRNYPQHGLNSFQKVQIFYKGVNVPIRKEIDIATCGSLMKKTPDEAHKIISQTATHSYVWHQDIDISRTSKVASVEASEELASVKVQLATFGRQMEKLTKDIHAMRVGCEVCHGPHLTKDCDKMTMEEQKKDPQVSNYSQVNAISSFEGYSSDDVVPSYTLGCEEEDDEFDDEVGFNSISTESVKNISPCEDDWIRVSDITPAYGNYLMILMTGNSSSLGMQESEVKSVETTEFPEFSVKKAKKVEVEDKVKSLPKLQVYKPPISYPRAIQSEQPKEIVCMPNYGKFLKELIAKKGVHEQASSAFLEEESAPIVKKNAMPPELADSGPFIVPCQVNGSELMSALADSSASIKLMTYSLYLRLNLGDLKTTATGVRLIDQSVSRPVRIAKNLVVNVAESQFPADFVVVDLKEDKGVPLVLGRPFLATAGALLNGKLGN
ncbi:uncharacterized protein [Rutidosis leptorrhynchoides]|uniref:uncharacterized protein n=1 Tax=Rutidosis leptorrhynchoides TaxID=125765 RepID=UPI003A99877C